MDKKTILEKGLLELYFFDELTASEKKEVELLIDEDAEVSKIYKELEQTFEAVGIENGIEPPKRVKAEIFDQISTSAQTDSKLNKSNSKFYLKIAASILPVLLLSTIWFFVKSTQLTEDLKITNTQIEGLQNQLDQLTDNYTIQNEWYTYLKDPDVVQYVLNGNDKLPEAKLLSYVNHETKTVIVNAIELPKADEGKDYQLWADVNGEMIDMGIIKKDEEFLAMNYITDAESYNITIEPEGGSEHPTVSNLIANVYLD